MTRITIEVDSSAQVTASTPSTAVDTASQALQGTPSTPVESTGMFAGAINAGSAPSQLATDRPVPFHGSTSVDSAIVQGAISAGPAPASVFQAPGDHA